MAEDPDAPATWSAQSIESQTFREYARTHSGVDQLTHGLRINN